MITRNRIKSLLTLAIVAMVTMATSVNAADIVYQDNYDNDGIGTNTGIGGGAVSINTSPASWGSAEGGWVDDGNLTMWGNGGSGGISGGSYSSNAFHMPGGFRLEVTYNALNSQDRFTMGLMEEAGTLDRVPTGTQPWPIGYLATSGTSAFEGIYFNAFAYDGQNRYPNAPGLQLADGTGMVQLSDAQSRDTGVHTLVLEMDADSNWSYSIDGAPATTGTITGGFDLSKSYSFITRNQPRRASQIYAVTLTSTGPTDPNAPSVDAGVDMITWSGQGVLLAPTVENNNKEEPQAALTYAWSADPDTGVVFSATDVEAPTVTITKATDNPSAVTLTLAVNNVGRLEPALEDTMTIDVYDDACEAAKAVGTVLDETDFDANCITNLADFAIVALDWLSDYAITAPVAKP